jgi:hypothetical protein
LLSQMSSATLKPVKSLSTEKKSDYVYQNFYQNLPLN